MGEVVVSGRNPRELVEEAIRKIPANYSAEADRLTGFYRETSRKRRHYINIAEAVIDLHKTPYTQDAGHDRVRILKGRHLLSPKASDMLAIKLLGGPNASVYLDVVKNPDLPAQSRFSGEEHFHASPLICCDRFEINRSKEFVRPEAKLLRLVGEVARRAGGVSHAQE